jgi:hypothetical protein
MRTFKLAVVILAYVMGAPLLAQADEAMELQRQILMSEKKLAVLQNMEFTESEKEAFWPVYDKYQDELFRVNRKTGQVVMKFAAAYKSLTDDKAKELMREYLAVEKERVKLKESYMKKFEKVLPPKKVMRYLQVENKLDIMARYELSKGIPLAQ